MNILKNIIIFILDLFVGHDDVEKEQVQEEHEMDGMINRDMITGNYHTVKMDHGLYVDKEII